jgi:hypothetical protein
MTGKKNPGAARQIRGKAFARGNLKIQMGQYASLASINLLLLMPSWLAYLLDIRKAFSRPTFSCEGYCRHETPDYRAASTFVNPRVTGL